MQAKDLKPGNIFLFMDEEYRCVQPYVVTNDGTIQKQLLVPCPIYGTPLLYHKHNVIILQPETHIVLIQEQ